jgi:hypothetical protein
MTEENNELKINFAPGCFDSFEGTQEELDELMSEIVKMFESGEALEQAKEVDFENPSDEDLEIIAHIMSLEDNTQTRTLQ